jgi:hypothetical protein
MRALMLVAVLLLTGCENAKVPAQLNESTTRYMIVAESRGGVWRLDRKTGDLRLCIMGADTQVRCWLAPTGQPQNSS